MASKKASNDDKTAKIKIGVASASLLIAALLLAHTFGLITLWGGVPKAPPEEPAAKAERIQAQEIKKKEIQELQNKPGGPKVIIAGQ